jgi:hypothetical protein
MMAEVQKLSIKKIQDKREEMKLEQMKAVIKELNNKIAKQQETIKKHEEKIAKLKYDKGVGPQVDSMVQIRLQHEEMRLKYEQIRNENINLKKVQSMQGNELMRKNDGKNDLKIDQLMNEVRYHREKNNELHF